MVEALTVEAIFLKSDMVLEALRKCGITGEALKSVTCDGWSYGCDEDGDVPRYVPLLMYSRDPKTNHPESNLYAFPLPFVPVYDMLNQEFVRIDWVATGGDDDDVDGINYNTRVEGKNCLEQCAPVEYHPVLVPNLRTDLKPYNVLQPEGPSFSTRGNFLVRAWLFTMLCTMAASYSTACLFRRWRCHTVTLARRFTERWHLTLVMSAVVTALMN
jgi:primary-amine oxidase